MAQCLLQIAHIFNVLIEHKLPALTVVHAQKVEEVGCAMTIVLKQLTGETTIEELHALADRSRFMQPGKFAFERPEIQLQHPCLTRSPFCASLLKTKKFHYRDNFMVHLLNMSPQVLPTTDSGAKRHVDPGRVDHRLLGGSDQALQFRCASNLPLPGSAKSLITVKEFRAQKKWLV